MELIDIQKTIEQHIPKKELFECDDEDYYQMRFEEKETKKEKQILVIKHEGTFLNFFINEYLSRSDDSRIELIKVIIYSTVKTLQEIYKIEIYNHKQLYTIQDTELRDSLFGFIDFWIEDPNFDSMIKNIINHDIKFLFLMFRINCTNQKEQTVDYTRFIDKIFNKEFSLSIEPHNLYEMLCDTHDLDCYSLNGWTTFDYIFSLYFSFRKNKKDEVITLFNKTHSHVFSDLIKNGFENGWINKSDYFKEFFKKPFKFNTKDILESLVIRDILENDVQIASLYHKELYQAIPDNYNVLKTDRGFGVSRTVKLLAIIPETKNNPVVEILKLLKSGEAKKMFLNLYIEYGAEELAYKIKEFKKIFPKTYKSTFENKNPLVLSPTQKDSQAAFENVMIYMRIPENQNNMTNAKKRL